MKFETSRLHSIEKFKKNQTKQHQREYDNNDKRVETIQRKIREEWHELVPSDEERAL